MAMTNDPNVHPSSIFGNEKYLSVCLSVNALARAARENERVGGQSEEKNQTKQPRLVYNAIEWKKRTQKATNRMEFEVESAGIAYWLALAVAAPQCRC